MFHVSCFMLNRRHRRGYYSLAQPSPFPSIARRSAVLLAIAVLLFYAGSKILAFFGAGNLIMLEAAELIVDGQGSVSVSIEGEELKSAQDGIKLYAGDSVKTGGRSSAILMFFDGTWVRLDESS